MTALPTLRQLEYFCAIAERGSFHAAARACGVSQPGLSQQLGQLEDLLEVELFERVRPRVLLTAAGSTLLERARDVLLGAEELVATSKHFAKPFCGPLHLGVIPTIAPYWLPRVLGPVRTRYPELQLMLREDQTAVLLDALASGELDLLLLALDVDLGDAHAQPLFDDFFHAVVPRSHRLAGRKRLRPSDLDGEAVLLLEDGHCLRDQALAICSSGGAQEWGDFRATSLSTLTQMVASGMGMTLLPEMALPALAQGNPALHVCPFTKPAPGRSIGLAWRPTSPRAAEYEALGALLAQPQF